jgi:mono/diheme cytochrome c family protein
MPNLFLAPEGEGDKLIDPAADIAAFLLKLEGGPADYKPTAEYDEIAVDEAELDALVKMMVSKLLTEEQTNTMLRTGVYPIETEKIKGDEIELVPADASAPLDAAEWKQRKLVYVGRKTITKYGCYGCHDVPNFETARPIGTTLQDWGKKDRSRLAFEHIHEFLHHHGAPGLGLEFETVSAADAKRLGLESGYGVRLSGIEPGVTPIAARIVHDDHAHDDRLQVDDVILTYDGQTVSDAAQLRLLLRSSVPATPVDVTIWRKGREETLEIAPDGSTEARVKKGVKAAGQNAFKNPADRDRELSAGFYYQSLLHHGRPGFLWQKLRQPRSFDYRMVETKPYDDRLRMPKFPLTEEDIDDIATFVLGLLAEPPHVDYLYNPSGPEGAKIRGEYLLDQYNCGGCHMLDMPKIRYGAELDDLLATDLSGEFPTAVDLLHRLKPPRNGLTDETIVVKRGDKTSRLPVVEFRGIIAAHPNPDDDPEDQEYVAELWETLQVGDKLLAPTSKIIFPAAALQKIEPSHGGQFAEWLADHLFQTKQVQQVPLGWQAAPPPLYLEGIKVQTPWLYNFLRNPYQLRHTTVLRMPRFNMSPDEAQALANYFAAQDGTPYPYQNVDEKTADYLAARNAEFKEQWPNKSHDYLTESWKVLNAPLCIKCHAVGGRQPITTDPTKDVRAPNLEFASERLRPDWLLLWLYKSPWITPYTSMPQNFPPGKKNLEELFDGDGSQQTIAVRDALLNYHRLMERDGRIVYDPPMAPMPNTTETGTAQAAPKTPANAAADSGGTK